MVDALSAYYMDAGTDGRARRTGNFPRGLLLFGTLGPLGVPTAITADKTQAQELTTACGNKTC